MRISVRAGSRHHQHSDTLKYWLTSVPTHTALYECSEKTPAQRAAQSALLRQRVEKGRGKATDEEWWMQPATELDLGFAQGTLPAAHKTFCTEPHCGEEVHRSPQPRRRADGDQRPCSGLGRGGNRWDTSFQTSAQHQRAFLTAREIVRKCFHIPYALFSSLKSSQTFSVTCKYLPS